MTPNSSTILVFMIPARKSATRTLVERRGKNLVVMFIYFLPIKGLLHENLPKEIHHFCILVFKSSSVERAKNEKRPWILRSREASVQVESGTNLDSDQNWPSTLIYISCGWDSFKEVGTLFHLSFCVPCYNMYEPRICMLVVGLSTGLCNPLLKLFYQLPNKKGDMRKAIEKHI